jgi:ssDNA-binding Zn-finger/Zn-ribbon topoisomerase 1
LPLLSRLLKRVFPPNEAGRSTKSEVHLPRYIDEKRAKAIRQATLFAETNGAKGAPQCPRCGAEMALEMARFWGCTEYPSCKAMRKHSYDPAGQLAGFLSESPVLRRGRYAPAAKLIA